MADMSARPEGVPGVVALSASTSSEGSNQAAQLHSPSKSHKCIWPSSGHLAAVALAYPEISIFCIRKSNPLRRFCILLSHSQLFENFILFCILCNCVTLGMSSNRQGFDEATLGKVLNKFEYLWVAIFSAEALLKIVSMGFILAPGTYLRDGWNWIDFVVVALGYVDIFTSGNMTAVRTVRVLRPLRAVTRVRGMKVLVSTMIGSMPQLLDVVALCAFVFFVWGIVAVQLFAGALRSRCGQPDFTHSYTMALVDGSLAVHNVSYIVSDDAAGDVCSGPLASGTSWYDMSAIPRGNISLGSGGSSSLVALPGTAGGGYACPADTYCTPYGNPNYGMTSFDTILWAWLTIFQCITLESWTDVMYATSDAVSWWVWPLFVGLVVFGAFFLVSLALAVLFLQFSTENYEQHEEERAKQQQKQQRNEKQQQKRERDREDREEQRRGSNGDDGGGNNSAGFTSDGEESCGASEMSATQAVGGGVSGKPMAVMGQESTLREMKSSIMLTEGEMRHLSRTRLALYRLAVSRGLTLTTIALILVNTVVMCVNWYGMPYSVEKATNYINYGLTAYFTVELVIKMAALGATRFFRDGMNLFDFIVVVASVAEMIVDLIPSVSGLGPLSVLRMLRLLRIFRLARNWRELYVIIVTMLHSVLSTTYLMALMLLFMFIAALMGMQLFGYKFMFCDYVDGARPVCPLGQRVWGQCPNHFHCYLPCEHDQVGTWIDAPGSFFNGLAYCERFCATTGSGAAAAMGGSTTGNSTAAVVAVAAAAASDGGGGGDGDGSGCELLAMVGKSQVPRAQFDNIFWAMYTVLQLLTGENWNNIMYDGMRTTSPYAALYFVIVLLLGTYLVFNLFIAILLDNFAGPSPVRAGTAS